jgi:transglutaminase-like putative cysteine protease
MQVIKYGASRALRGGLGLALLALAPGLAFAGDSVPSRDAWYEFLFHGKKVGFLHALDETSTLEGRPALHAHRRSVVTVRRQDHEIRMEATTDAWAEPNGKPLKFTHARVENGARRDFMGVRDGAVFRIALEVGGKRTEHTVPAEDLRLSASLDALFKRDLKVGKRWTGKALVEEDGEVRDYRMEVVRAEGDGFVVESEIAGVVSHEWVTKAGHTKRTEVPRLGAEFREAERSVALSMTRTEDIFTAARLLAGTRLPSGDELDALVVRLSARSGRVPRPVVGHRQKVKKLSPTAIELTVQVEDPPRRGARLPIRSKAQARFLRETAYEAIGDARLVERAKKITEGASDAWAAARAINAFVHTHIQDKSLAHAYSTANEALEAAAGDCTEHSVLFSALAKIVGLPTKLVTGLVYVGGRDGIFGYHQWVEVWIGDRWVAMDPTFGQDVADPTHIKFTEGSSDPEGLREAGLAAAELFGDIDLRVVAYTRLGGETVTVK